MRNNTLGLALLSIFGACVPAAAQEAMLSGSVVDAQHRGVTDAVVVVCEHGSGIPVSQTSFRPITEDMKFQQIAFAVTDAQGRFSLPNAHDIANGRDTVLEAACSWLLHGE